MQQYYKGKGKWEYMPVAGFTKAFQQTHLAQSAWGQLAQPYEAPNAKCMEALAQHRYALNGEQSPLHSTLVLTQVYSCHLPLAALWACIVGADLWADAQHNAANAPG